MGLMNGLQCGQRENVSIEAFDEDGNSVGVFDSISKAGKKLFIRYDETIWRYLNGNSHTTFKGKKKGIKSYKTGKRYHFKKVQ